MDAVAHALSSQFSFPLSPQPLIVRLACVADAAVPTTQYVAVCGVSPDS